MILVQNQNCHILNRCYIEHTGQDIWYLNNYVQEQSIQFLKTDSLDVWPAKFGL